MKTECPNRILDRIRHVLHLDELSPSVRRLVVGVVGTTIVLIGLAMTILPGPAIIVIPLGLAVLGTEFMWARRCVYKARDLLEKAKGAVTRSA